MKIDFSSRDLLSNVHEKSIARMQYTHIRRKRTRETKCIHDDVFRVRVFRDAFWPRAHHLWQSSRLRFTHICAHTICICKCSLGVKYIDAFNSKQEHQNACTKYRFSLKGGDALLLEISASACDMQGTYILLARTCLECSVLNILY